MSKSKSKVRRKKGMLEGELKRWADSLEAEPFIEPPPPEPEAPPEIKALPPPPRPRPRTPEEFRAFINIPEWRRQLIIHDMVMVEIVGRLLDAFEWAVQELEIATRVDHVGGPPAEAPPE